VSKIKSNAFRTVSPLCCKFTLFQEQTRDSHVLLVHQNVLKMQHVWPVFAHATKTFMLLIQLVNCVSFCFRVI
jgi:hypothetical protein